MKDYLRERAQYEQYLSRVRQCVKDDKPHPDNEHLRRRTDTQPAQLREAISFQLRETAKLFPGAQSALTLAADTLERDERNNAEMIDVLMRAGYKDIPARIDATVIKRLLGYVTPGV